MLRAGALKENRAGMARFGIKADRAFGVSQGPHCGGFPSA